MPDVPPADPADPVALVALRDPGVGKSRLAALLPAAERAAVARAMARDVLAALAGAGVAEVVVVAGGPAAARFAAGLGVPVLRDRRPGGDLSAAFEDAVGAVGRSRTALLVCADLPGLRAADVAAVAGAAADVVVAPTHDGGTGGLLLRPGARIALAYGPGSAAAHRERARASGLQVAEVRTAGFRHDVDEPADLHGSADRWPGSHTAALVRELVARGTVGPAPGAQPGAQPAIPSRRTSASGSMTSPVTNGPNSA